MRVLWSKKSFELYDIIDIQNQARKDQRYNQR